MSTCFYRFICADVGIYEAVEKDCPRDDGRRKAKPDGAWLPKVGPNYPGAISFWTEVGLQKYMDSGLLAWHCSVVQYPVQVMVCSKMGAVLYTDEYQVICTPENVLQKEEYRLDKFLQTRIE